MSLQAAMALPAGVGLFAFILYAIGCVARFLSTDSLVAAGDESAIIVGMQVFAEFFGVKDLGHPGGGGGDSGASPIVSFLMVLLTSPKACAGFFVVGAGTALLCFYLITVVLPGLRMDWYLSRIPGIPHNLVFDLTSDMWMGEAREVFAPEELLPGGKQKGSTKMRKGKCICIPQSVRRLPILGHALGLIGPAPWTKMALWSLAAAPEKASPAGKEACESNKHIGRLVTFNIGQQRIVYINDPQLLKKVLLTKQRYYCKDIKNSYQQFLCLLGTGLVTSEGDRWRKGRLLLSHALRIDILHDVPGMTMKAVRRIMYKIETATQALAELEKSTVKNHGDRKPDDDRYYVDLNEEFRHMTLQVIGETALSLTPDETDRIFPALYLPIVHECNRRVRAPWRQYMPFLEGSVQRNTCLAKLNEVLCSIIRSRWKQNQEALANQDSVGTSAKRPDIMQLCMSQIKKMDETMIVQLRDDVKTMLLAGHETSAALLTWATYELICHPEFRMRVVEEARALFTPQPLAPGVTEEDSEHHLVYNNVRFKIPTVEEIRTTLRWTPAVLRETLRKHSVVPLVMRQSTQDDVWKPEETGLPHDVVIPTGCTIAVGVLGVHMRPDMWKDPGVFNPNRFLDAVIANDTNQLAAAATPASKATLPLDESKTIDPYAYIPFINGPRNCLGQHLSIMETQTALAFLVLNYALHLYNPAKDYSATFAAAAQVGKNGCERMKTPILDEKEDVAFARQVGVHHDYIIPRIPHDGLKVFGFSECALSA